MHLITSPSDIYHATGVRFHDPGEILLLVTGKGNEGIVLCDPRTSALFDRTRFQIIDQRKEWKGILSRYPTLSTDPDFLTQTLREKIEGYGVRLSMKPSPITQKRLLKTDAEIRLLAEAQKLNRDVYAMIVPFLVPGVTEEAIARKIQILQLELGASGPSFSPIVAFGEHTAIPHHSPTQRRLTSADPVLIDMGLVYEGYCSDMTRCLQIKKEKLKKKNGGSFEEIYKLLQDITHSIISWARPGMKVADLDKKARNMLGEYEPYFTHSLGHGVGIDIHEAPRISTKSKEILQPGMVITIEPGIYIPGKYGARHEEMVVVGKEELNIM